MKKLLVVFLMAILAIAIVGVMIDNHKIAPAMGLVRIIQPATIPTILEFTLPSEIPAVASKSEIQTVQTRIGPVAQTQKFVAQNLSPASHAKGKKPVQDPAARVALSLVGADPDAEAYWMSAISDPNLPDQEREDLMEDLNEDGLSDPKHPGPADLPLILNRIALIEEIAPTADPFMQEHLGEAYKDLNDMLAGKTVQ